MCMYIIWFLNGTTDLHEIWYIHISWPGVAYKFILIRVPRDRNRERKLVLYIRLPYCELGYLVPPFNVYFSPWYSNTFASWGPMVRAHRVHPFAGQTILTSHSHKNRGDPWAVQFQENNGTRAQIMSKYQDDRKPDSGSLSYNSIFTWILCRCYQSLKK